MKHHHSDNSKLIIGILVLIIILLLVGIVGLLSKNARMDHHYRRAMKVQHDRNLIEKVQPVSTELKVN